MKAIIPLTPPGYKQNNLPGSVKELCAYVRNLQEQLDFTLGQLQKGVESGKALYDEGKSEFGKTGDWFWEKRSDGVSVCWAVFSHSVVVNTPWGSVYESEQSFGDLAYPEGLFVGDEPAVSITVSGVQASTLSAEIAGGSLTKCPYWHYVRPTANANARDYKANVLAIGHWK